MTPEALSVLAVLNRRPRIHSTVVAHELNIPQSVARSRIAKLWARGLVAPPNRELTRSRRLREGERFATLQWVITRRGREALSLAAERGPGSGDFLV